MENKQDYFYQITNTSALVYNKISNFLEKYKEHLQKKKLAVFGCGVRGSLISILLKQHGFMNFYFTDNNPDLYGNSMAGNPIIAPEEILNNPNLFNILISPENGSSIIEMLNRYGYKTDENMFFFGNIIYPVFLNEYDLPQREHELLIMGDCGFIHCSLTDKDRRSLADMLKLELDMPVRRLLVNAMSIRAMYNIMLGLSESGKLPRSVIFPIEVAKFNGIQQFYPGGQHVDLFSQLCSLQSNLFDDYLQLLKKRYSNFDQNAFAKKARDIDNIVANNLYIKSNYTFRLKMNPNEELDYLHKLVRFLLGNKIILYPVILPINYEKCRFYQPDNFDSKYEQNCLAVIEEIAAYGISVLNLSYLLSEEYFPDKNTFDEAFNDAGRKLAVDKILKFIK